MRIAAGRKWGNNSQLAEEIMVTITYVYEDSPMDVDNVPKPILDGLKGLIYFDDSQVTDLLCRKRRNDLELRMPNPPSLLRSTHERTVEFVHVSVENAPKSEVPA